MRSMTRPATWLLTLGLALTATAAAADPQTRAFRQAFPLQTPELRLANLAGRVELVRGEGRGVVVEATVHAEGEDVGETKKLLDGMRWVRGKDTKGRDEWALSYPLERYKSYAYPRPKTRSSGFWSFLENMGTSSTTYRGERVRIYGERRSSAPILYADLRIALPAGSNAVVLNAVGAVNGGAGLEGTLGVQTGSGDIRLAAYSGRLTVGTGSGDVSLGAVKGETTVGTGSGDVAVRRLVGNGSFETGSGDVTVESASAGKLALSAGSGDLTVRGGDAGRVIADTSSGTIQLLGVAAGELSANTGSGDVVLRGPLARTKKVTAETGSGDVRITAGAEASFDIDSHHGSGELVVRYADAALRRDGRKLVGAKRGGGHTVIHVETGSGDCVIGPQ
jgi:DUF4097 and DUF4098 domain-containing protein YvlB